MGFGQIYTVFMGDTNAPSGWCNLSIQCNGGILSVDTTLITAEQQISLQIKQLLFINNGFRVINIGTSANSGDGDNSELPCPKQKTILQKFMQMTL